MPYGGFWDQLHESHRPCLRDHGWIKRRFGLYDRKEQGGLNMVLLSCTDDGLFKFWAPHSTVIADTVATSLKRLLCRYICGVHQFHGTDVFLNLHIGENRRRPSCRQYDSRASSEECGILVAECSRPQVIIMRRSVITLYPVHLWFLQSREQLCAESLL